MIDIEAMATRIQHRELSMRVAGILEPPPAMVKDISEWIAAKILVNKIISERQRIPSIKMVMEATREGIRHYTELGNERMVKDETEDLIETEKLLKGIYEKDREMVRELNSYGGRISKKPWKRVSKKFKADFRGWRYASLLNDAEDKRLSYADKLFGVLTVQLVDGGLRGNAKAYWDSGNSTIRISVGLGVGLEGTVAHEMRHWTQSYMRVALGEKEFGIPSRSIRTPDIDQHADKETLRYLKKQGINPDEIHNLDDVEFYTDLADAVGEFRYESKEFDNKKSIMDFFRAFTVQDDNPMAKRLHNKYFKTLRKHAPDKWKKAVKELAKAVL